MTRLLASVGTVVVVTMLLSGCGDNTNDNVVIIPGRTATPIHTPTTAATAHPTVTAVQTPPVEATETPAPGATETPGPIATATATGGLPTVTPTPGAAATKTPTPAPTSTAAAATCGNSIKEAGEQCDTGTVFSTSSDCAATEQCACCLCRPDSIHASVPTTHCTTCHGSIAPVLTFPAGAAQTFPGLCQ